MPSLLFNSHTIYYSDHVYLRHLLTEYRPILSAHMSTSSRPILDRVVVNMFLKLIDCGLTHDYMSVCRSVCWTTPRPICCDPQSPVYRSTVSGIGVLLTVVLLK